MLSAELLVAPFLYHGLLCVRTIGASKIRANHLNLDSLVFEEEFTSAGILGPKKQYLLFSRQCFEKYRHT